MRRFVGSFLFLTVLLSLAVGCLREPTIPSNDPTTGNLVLVLPKGITTDHKDRQPRLWIDGHDYSEPRSLKRTLQIEAKPGTDKVTIKYSFWPFGYSNTVRTKVVTLIKDSPVTVDFSKEDPETPDEIFPIYVPTPYEVVDKMCEMAKIGPKDIVHDIGCGDGRLVIRAVKKYGTKKGVGIDINPVRIKECWANAKKEGVTGKVDFRVEDALNLKDFSEASVVLLYVGEDLNVKLKPLLQKSLKTGSRIVSHRFLIEGWKPDETKEIKAKDDYREMKTYELHLWMIR